MLYLNSYIRLAHTRSFFDRTGKFFDALLVSKDSTEFADLLSVIDKPIYAITATIRMKTRKFSDETARLPNVSISPVAKEFIFKGVSKCPVDKSRSTSTYEKSISYESPEVLIIPVIYRSLAVGTSGVAADINMPIQYMNCTNAMFYTKEQPDGYVDTMLMTEPLNILEGRSSLIIKDSIASENDISSALWKMRNRIHIKRVYSSKTKFWNEMFTIKGSTDDIQVMESTY